jgi:hypothetical protein
VIAHHHAAVVPPTRLRRVLYLFALALAPIACVVLYLFNPAADDDPYPNCPFLWLTGYYCPGCGSLRAYHQLLRGNVDGAIGLNPITVLALPAMIYAVASAWLTGFRGTGLPQPRWSVSAIWSAGAFLVVFAVVRNLPLDALEWMRP